MTAGGYFGRALIMDASTGSSDTMTLPGDILRAYIGGAGLGAWLMHRLAPPQVDPLSAAAPLAYVFSPLVGTPLTTSAKFAVVAKSPLTGLLTDALASSHFALAGKLTGYDAIVIKGACTTPSALLIDENGPRLTEADDLMGLTAAQAAIRLRQRLGERLGRGWRVAAIGPAGERGVRYATISHDGRHAGRGGLGAVLGAKRIKAIAVRAAAKVAPADPAAVLAQARDLRQRSFGPATAKYRELGTLANLLAFNAIATLPTRNFQAATFEEAPRLAEEDSLIDPADNPARKVDKPRRLPSTRRAVADTRLAEINHAATTGDDPELDTLLLHCTPRPPAAGAGALALRPQDLDPEQCLILLREKGETVRWQPVSPPS
jgi:aldehyde:ferredoxin oxidoreductase